MIYLNDDFIANTMRNTITTSSKFGIILLDGVMPTEEVLIDKVNGTYYYMNTLAGKISGINSVKGVINYATDFRGEVDNNQFKLELAKRLEEFELLEVGAVTWFMAAYCTSAVTAAQMKTFSFEARQLIVGSVGAIGSGADMEIPLGAIAEDTTYKSNDIKFNFS